MALTKVSPDTTGMSSVDFSETAVAAGSTITDFYSVDTKDTDGPSGFGETEWTPDWKKWHGYYRKIPEFQATIDKFASWAVGRGLEADEKNQDKMDKITGFGKDDFNTLLENLTRSALIAGDGFAEIIKDSHGRVTNLKPLNPGSMNIVVNEFGILKRYEQISQNPTTGQSIVIGTWEPKDMLHLAWNRIADEIHGIPFAEKLERLILMRNESMEDQKTLFHRYVKPIHWIEVDTDDATELASIQTKHNNAYKKSENIIVPKGVIGEIKTMSIPQYSTLDPLPWLKYLVRQFVTSCGMPEVIMGWGEETTEASSKIIYLAFQQTIERFQRYLEAQFKMQVNIIFDLKFPASIEEDLKEDEGKDSSLEGERKSETKP